MPDWYRVDSIEVAHEDTRRSLIVLFNGDFVARQVKVLKVKKESVLGNHFHRYREMFYLLSNKRAMQFDVVYHLKNVKTSETVEVKLRVGERLIIEPFVAHAALMGQDVITIEASEEVYISPEKNDVHYEVI